MDVTGDAGTGAGQRPDDRRVPRFGRGDRRGASGVVAPASRPPHGPGGEGPPVGSQSDRRVPPGPARGRGPAPVARGRPRDPHPSADLRPDRAPPDARGGRRLPRRSRARCLRAAGRPAAGFAPLRRALGQALARSGAIRRDQRIRARLGQAVRLAVSRLCDRRVQPGQALRPIRPRATGRRRARPRLGRGAGRDGILPTGHLGRRAGRPAAGPLRRTRRDRLHHRTGPAGHDGQLRPLPRSQGRSDSPGAITTGSWPSSST